jgi:chemotaxis signal transduction protein
MSAMSDTYVLLELAGSLYGVAAEQVLHIDMVEHVTLVPKAHPAIEGVVFSRGQVIPALNLRTRFGFPLEPRTRRTRIVFVQVQRRIIGLITDAAREFKRISDQQIRPIGESLTGVAGNYLKGVAGHGERLVLMLDLEKVVEVNDPTIEAERIKEIAEKELAEAGSTDLK